ncbi:peptidylprolyl isomerase [Candidatus Pelagibacter sp.]|jgi:peptidyl-prolyl cis-trans isomerase SurA|nr:peptidylprolyl isomerase [Candidatus Pelagibacter sp.]
MFKKRIIIFLIFFFFIFNSSSFSIENKILLKIENQIITSLDVRNEYNYLIALNPVIQNSNEDEIIKFSKKSIIQEKIKQIEIRKNFKESKIDQKFLEQILKDVYNKIGINNLNDFKKYLKANNVDFKIVKKKLETEALWNKLILIKFSSKIKIDEENIRKKLQKDNDKYLKSYLLSEIFFEVSNLKNLDKKFSEISNTIKNKGFDFAALKYSSSSTSNLGGKLDWINENSLNKSIKNVIKDKEINDFTKPIRVPGGFLILQVNEIKNTKIKIDIDKELKKIVNYEKNNQLNQYSIIYFNKIKKNLEIREL